MKITKSIYIVGSGKLGFSFTHPLDCNIFLIDTGDGAFLIDSGVNLDRHRIVEVIEAHGFKLSDIKKILITHYHGDHAGGAAFFHEQSGAEVYAPAKEAPAIEAGDEEATSLAGSKGGFYPIDYTLQKCPVTKIYEGDKLSLGRVTFTAYTLPGHSLEDAVYYAEIDGKQCLFTGDAVFAAGQVLLQSLYDVSIYPYKLGIRKLSALKVDSLFPAHGIFSLENGGDHIKAAAAKFESGILPPQFFFFT